MKTTTLVNILKDGEIVATVEDIRVMDWFHDNHSFSMFHAVEHEGYSLHEVEQFEPEHLDLVLADTWDGNVGSMLIVKSPTDFSDFRLCDGYIVSERPNGYGIQHSVWGNRPNHNVAVKIVVTGRKLRSDSPLYNRDAVRVKIIFVGDGEEDVSVGGWLASTSATDPALARREFAS